jgi:hypothetical protein
MNSNRIFILQFILLNFFFSLIFIVFYPCLFFPSLSSPFLKPETNTLCPRSMYFMATSSLVSLWRISLATPKFPDPMSFTSFLFSICIFSFFRLCVIYQTLISISRSLKKFQDLSFNSWLPAHQEAQNSTAIVCNSKP